MSEPTVHELAEANRKAHDAFLAIMRKQRDTTKPPRGAMSAYRRACATDRAYQQAVEATMAEAEKHRNALDAAGEERKP